MACPCYDKGSVVPPGQVVNKEGVMWYENHILHALFIMLLRVMCMGFNWVYIIHQILVLKTQFLKVLSTKMFLYIKTIKSLTT